METGETEAGVTAGRHRVRIDAPGAPRWRWQGEVEGGDGAAGVAERHIARLRAALRRERMRGRSGHWTYDLTRHLALSRQLRKAEADLKAQCIATAAPLRDARPGEPS